SFGKQLAETAERSAQIDDACAALGRDPSSLRRSYLMFDARSRASGGSLPYYESDSLFVDMVGRITELGISEVGLYYPVVAAQRPMFEKIAREIIPRMKAGAVGTSEMAQPVSAGRTRDDPPSDKHRPARRAGAGP